MGDDTDENPTDAVTDEYAGENPAARRSGAMAVAAGIFSSRIAGFVREVLIGAALGATPAGDAYRAAVKLPNLLQNLLGEGVLSASFIPVYSRLLEEKRPEDARRLARAALGWLSLIAGLIALVIVVAARPLTAVLATGFSGDRFELTVELTRYIAVGTAFLVPSAWCLGILNSHRRFFVSYVAPVAWNVVQIIVLAIVILRGWATEDAATAAALALTVAGLAQFLVQLPFVRRVHGPPTPTLDRAAPGLADARRRLGPAIIGRGAAQIVGYVDLWLATWLAAGAVAVLGFAQILYLLPISLFAMSVAAAELPELSRIGRDDVDVLLTRAGKGLRRILIFVGFTAAVFIATPQPLVAVLLQRGEFGRPETIAVALTLTAFGLGLIPAALSRLLQNILYALDDVATTARISIARLSIATVIGGVLMFPFDRLLVLDGDIVGLLTMDELGPLSAGLREDSALPLRLGAVGLALGAAAGAWYELAQLRYRIIELTQADRLLGGTFRTFAAATAGAVVIMAGIGVFTTGLPPLVRLLASVIPGGIFYLSALLVGGVDEASDLIATIRRRASSSGSRSG